MWTGSGENPLNRTLLLRGLIAGLFLFLLVSGVQAQVTSTVSNLFLSPGGELDFRLFGVNGGSGTNGTNSDRFAVQNQFNTTNPSSAGIYTIGFSLGDTVPLTPGTNFTLVTYSTTNFVDASKFRAVSQDPLLTSIDGSFRLIAPDPTNGQTGSLVFTLGSFATVPEPASLWLCLVALALSGHFFWRANRCFISGKSSGSPIR